MAQPHPAIVLIDMVRRARLAASPAELNFLLVNDTYRLVPYRQAALWSCEFGVQALSGVMQIESNAPYVQWLNRVFAWCAENLRETGPLAAERLPAPVAQDWGNWLPPHAYWLALSGADGAALPSGGLLLIRDLPWQEQEIVFLREWVGNWQLASKVLQPRQPWGWRSVWRGLTGRGRRSGGARSVLLHRGLWLAGVLAAASFIPVDLSVLAPGELVPANPSVIRSPLEGVIESIHVQPNQAVIVGQPLFDFDTAIIHSKLEVAQQSLATAQVEYRQMLQLAVTDARAKAQLALLLGKAEERRADVEFYKDQLSRSHVTAPRDGLVLLDDPLELVGRPVAVGEAVMRVAALSDVEVEAWISIADAIPLPEAAEVSLYISADPLKPVRAQVRYMAYEAVKRADGSFAYRIRATLKEPTNHRVGLKGTARVTGGTVPLAYWVFRRPLAGLRSFLAL